MTTPLKDGTTPQDPRLDRLVQFDERSRSHPIRAMVEGKSPRSYTWRCGAWLDQGREGACVGFSLAHELAARPMEIEDITDVFARTVYHAAQKSDPWPGGEYPGATPRYSGTSVLAGVKVVHGLGYCQAYRWAFGLRDLILGVGYNGPAVIGVNWYSGLYMPDDAGVVEISGDLVGGHAILVRGIDVKNKTFRLRNSWGRGWGLDGDCFMSFATMERLLHEEGEAVFLQKRKNPVGL